MGFVWISEQTAIIYLHNISWSALGVSAKLQKATISFVMSVCPSVCTVQLGSHWEFDMVVFFENLSTNSRFIMLYMTTYIYDHISLTISYNRNVSES